MASGEMSDPEFLGFNKAWMNEVLHYLVDGGVFGTFIDWRGRPQRWQKQGSSSLSLVSEGKSSNPTARLGDVRFRTMSPGFEDARPSWRAGGVRFLLIARHTYPP